MEITNLADLYGLAAMDWAAVRARLMREIPQAPGSSGPNRHTCWLTTLNADGSPHVTGIGALWVDDAFWFETGEQTRKGRNLGRDPRCALSLATQEFDLVVEGDAVRVTHRATLASLAQRWAAQGWPASVDETGQALTAEYSAPSAGPPPWAVYRLTPKQATALGTIEPRRCHPLAVLTGRWRLTGTARWLVTRPWHAHPMRHSDFWRLVDDEFGAGYGRTLVRDQVLGGLNHRTAEQALAAGESPRTVWQALCAEMDVPPERRWGRDEQAAATEQSGRRAAPRRRQR